MMNTYSIVGKFFFFPGLLSSFYPHFSHSLGGGVSGLSWGVGFLVDGEWPSGFFGGWCSSYKHTLQDENNHGI